MKTVRLFLLLTAAPLLTLAADNSLLNLMMPDARVVAGVSVDQARSSPFGQYVLSHMEPDNADAQKFLADTGFDPRRDVSEIVMASNGIKGQGARWLLAGRGFFNTAKITASAQAGGAHLTSAGGVRIITPDQNAGPAAHTGGAIAFLNSNMALLGDLESVKAAIQRHSAGATASGTLSGKVNQVSANTDFWFTTLVPLSEFAAAMPDANLRGAMQGNLMQGVLQASGSVRFGPTVQINGEAVTRSEKDAQALMDAVRFLAGLIQTNREKDQTAGAVSTLLDSMQLNSKGTVVTMALSVPEQTLEQMLSVAHRAHSSDAKPR